MFTGLPYETVFEAAHHEHVFHPKKGMFDASKVLRNLGFGQANLGGSYEKLEGAREFTSSPYYFDQYVSPEFIRKMLWGRPALLSVPSRNKSHGWHYVYYDGKEVQDPQNGRRGKRFYTKLEELEPRSFLMWSHACP